MNNNNEQQSEIEMDNQLYEATNKYKLKDPIFKSKLKVAGVSLIAGFLIGSIASSDSKQIEELKSEITEVTASKDEYLDLAHNRGEELTKLKNTNESLQEKVDSAKPWFDKQEEERQAELAKIEQEKAEKKAQEEKAKQEAEAQKYNTGITFENLARNPDDNMMKKVKFKGKVLQVMNSKDNVQYRLAIDSNYDKVILLSATKEILKEGNVLENDQITIEGTFLMNTQYKTVMGATRDIPLVTIDNLYR